MAMKKYFIKNIKLQNFYCSYVGGGINHFVLDYREARKFNSIKEANKKLRSFKHQENFEVVCIYE